MGPNSPERQGFLAATIRVAHPAIPAAHRVAVQAGSTLRLTVCLPRPEKLILLLMHPQRVPIVEMTRAACAASLVVRLQ